MANSKITTQVKNLIRANNTIETGRSGSDLPRAFAQDVKQNVSAAGDDLFNQLLGFGDFENKKSDSNGESKPYEKVTLYSDERKIPKYEAPQPERKPAKAAGIDYHAEIAHGSERMSRKESSEIQYQIQEITQELQRLISSSNKIIQMEYGAISVSSTPKVAGKYHTNFLSWMLTVIRTARQKVEDSGAWLAVAKGKGNKRGYAQSSKAHGTSFTQSNERNVATQTG